MPELRELSPLRRDPKPLQWEFRPHPTQKGVLWRPVAHIIPPDHTVNGTLKFAYPPIPASEIIPRQSWRAERAHKPTQADVEAALDARDRSSLRRHRRIAHVSLIQRERNEPGWQPPRERVDPRLRLVKKGQLPRD